MRFLKYCSFLFVFIPLILFSGPRVEKPKEPVVDDVSEQNEKKEWRKTALVFHAESTLYGSVRFPAEEMTLYAGSSGIKKIINSSDIKAVHFKEWKGVKKKQYYVFYPVVTMITMKNGRRFVCYSTINSLLRFSFRDFGKTTEVFSYFIDYSKKGTWINKKVSSKKQRFKEPLAGVVTAVHFF